MDISEVFQKTDVNDVITELKSKRYIKEPNIELAEKQLDPKKHDVMDPVLRPNKRVKIDNPEPDEDNTITVVGDGETAGYKWEKVARISVAIQKLIVKRAVAFLFGNPVAINAEPETDNGKLVVTALDRILKDNKAVSLNRKVARQIFSCTEAAELWFPVPVEKTKTGDTLIAKVKDLVNNTIGNKYHENYGFKSKFKLRSAIFSPLLGDTLYPYFDESGDMIAFSREWQSTDQAKVAHTYFETYTDTQHLMWERATEGWKMLEGYPTKIEIGKIPIIYGHQESFEWEDVQGLIDRLEKLLSNFADTNDYHGSPKIVVTGKVEGFSKKGEAGGIIELEDGAKAEYLAWEQAPEAIKLEKETLLNLIYTLTQTPDISFDSVKGLSAMSGVALKLLFLDAHLKAKDKQEIFDEYMQRRINVIKAFIAKFNTALASECESLSIEPEITPYMIEDEAALINLLTTANGNKPLISKKLSAKLSNLAQDPEADFVQMEEESKAESTFTLGEPTV